MAEGLNNPTKTKPRVGDGTPGPGRPKGVPNKTTVLLKDMILQALDGAGGAAYLQRQAEENPGPFMSLVAKVLPMQVTGDPSAPLTFAIVRRELVRPDADNTDR